MGPLENLLGSGPGSVSREALPRPVAAAIPAGFPINADPVRSRSRSRLGDAASGRIVFKI